MKVLLIISILLVSNQSFSYSTHRDRLINKYKWLDKELYSIIQFVAKANRLHPALVCAVIHKESRGNRYAVGKAGERGLMQPLVCHYSGNPDDLFNPLVNVYTGCKYLKRAYIKSNGNIRYTLTRYNRGLNCKLVENKYANDIIKLLEVW